MGDNFKVHKKSCTLNTILHDSSSQTPSATKVGGGGGRKGRRKLQTAPDSPCTSLSRLSNDGGPRSAHVSLQIKVHHMKQLLTCS